MKQDIDAKILTLIKDKTSVEQGFRLLMDTYQERLYHQIRRMLNDHEDTNDVLQNVMIKVFRNINKFEQNSALYTWLYRIASNETISYIRSKKRKTTSSIENEDLGLENTLKAEQSFDGKDAERILQNALEELPEKERLVFNMRYFDEMSYKEISEVLNTSVGSLKASYHHAVKKIEHFIKQRNFI